MKRLVLIGTMVAVAATAYGQQPGSDPHTAPPSAQVAIQLQIAEVSLTKLQQSGFDLSRMACDGDASGNATADRATFQAQWAAIMKDGAKAQQLLESLRRDCLAKMLAEPTVVTVSGRRAAFNSGAELSVPKTQPDGSVALERQYGTMVELTPQVLDEQIDLAIHGRLSELDYSHTVRVGAETLPGVQFREFSTRAKLPSGQVLALTGPIQTRIEAISRGVPFVSQLPFVGALFRKVEEERNEVALLILLRPEIISASVPGIAPTGAAPQEVAPLGPPMPPAREYNGQRHRQP
jgi:pilus assembly protein CpaC